VTRVPYTGEYYNGPYGEVLSKKMFGLHWLVNLGHEPTLDTIGGLMYLMYNGRNTVSEITERHGDIIESYRYEAFGSLFEGITAPYNTSMYTDHHYDDFARLMDMKARGTTRLQHSSRPPILGRHLDGSVYAEPLCLREQ
jgi:hypothetical protein